MTSKSVPAHALYGVPATRNARPAGDTGSSRLASASAPYIGRGSKCAGNDDTCNANRVRGQELCAGHLKTQKAEKGEVNE